MKDFPRDLPPGIGTPTVVRSEKAAAAFIDPRRRRMIFELIRAERSLQDLATAVGIGLSLAHYHIHRLVALGLVREVRRKARAGRAVRIYAAAAPAFYVPGTLMPGEAEDLMADFRAGLDWARRGDADRGVFFFLHEGRPCMRRTAPQGRTIALDSWRLLALSDADAKRLATELESVLARFGKARPGAKKAYLIHAGLVPRAP